VYRVFPEGKPAGRGVVHPPTSSAEVKERVELYLYSSLNLRVLFYFELQYKYLDFLNHKIFWISLLDISASLDYDYHPVIFMVKSNVRH
jgi:hypothetical protein